MIRVVLVHPGRFLLPELDEELGDYTERKLRARNLEIIGDVCVAGYADGSLVTLSNGKSIPAAKNIEAAILGHPPTPFVFKTLGQLASIGHRTGVAMVFGIKFSGFIAWCLWRMGYLLKLPRLAKKLRVVSGWTLELLFSREIEQMITLRDVEELTNRLTRIRGRTEKETSRPVRTVFDPQAHLTLSRGK